MFVVDTERSERGPQRRKHSDGRLLHCCCICGKLETWSADWSAYASIKEMDDGVPYPKFCSDECRTHSGPRAKNITAAMKRKAKDSERREPNVVWREASDGEKYVVAADQQRRERERQERIDGKRQS